MTLDIRCKALPDRFISKVNFDGPGGCWLWLGARGGVRPGRPGYGRFWLTGEGRTTQAHRFAYEVTVGPIPDGLHVDHLCRNTLCVNPAHLEPVTCRENNLRSNNMAARHAVKTHCVNGHEFLPETTHYSPEGHRVCVPCRREKTRAYKARTREARRETH